jgi:hypothetical protein
MQDHQFINVYNNDQATTRLYLPLSMAKTISQTWGHIAMTY